ncbi:MAG: ROK family protein, partial [Bacillota bacterium]
TYSTREVFALAEKGNKTALKVIEEVSYNLALGLINIWQIIDPELIILGGGVIMGARQTLVAPVKNHIKNILPSGNSLISSLIISKLEQSGMVGAAAVLLERENTN